MTSFKDLSVGDTVKIIGYAVESALVERLKSLGLVRGTEITITRIAPLGDPYEISVRGYKLGLRKAEGDLLQLQSS